MSESSRGRGRTVVREWEPMRLRPVGQVGELMRMTTSGSKRDSTMGCGTTRKRTGPPPGTAC